MANGIEGLVGGLDAIGFFSYVIPYLLTVAIVYGILEHVKLPQSKSVRSVLAIIAGFLVLPLGPVIQPYLSRLGLSIIVLTAGILTLVVISESLGLKASGKKHLWEEHPKIASALLIGLGILVFIAAGGLEFLGLGGGGISSGPSLTVIFFLGITALGIWWITKEK